MYRGHKPNTIKMQGESDQNAMQAQQKNKRGEGKGQSVDTMLEFNALQYNMWPDLTVCVDRTMKNSYFQTSEYGNDNKTAYCILNTGSDFILGRTSYLVFDLEVDNSSNPSLIPLWGAAGSAYNLIKRLTITDRSGNELERIQDVNRLVNLQIRHTQSEKFLTSVGSCFLNPAEINSAHAITSQFMDHEPYAVSGVVENGPDPAEDSSWPTVNTATTGIRANSGKVIQPALGGGVSDVFFDPPAMHGANQFNRYSNNPEPKTIQNIPAALKWAYSSGKEVTTAKITFTHFFDHKLIFPLGTVICYKIATGAANPHSKLQLMTGQPLRVLGHAVEAKKSVLIVTKNTIIHGNNDAEDTLAFENLKTMIEIIPERYAGDQYIRNNPAKYSVSHKRWCLPLRFMSGLFDYDQLLPMQLMSGLRIQIEWASISEAFRWAGSEAKSDFSNMKYTIKNPRIVTDSCKLTDSILQELNSRSANNGLELVYRTFFTTVNTPDKDQAELNIESRKSVSRCFGAFATFYRNYCLSSDMFARDRMETLAMNASEWQWRAGNLYFPNQMMKASQEDYGLQSMAIETYMHVMRMFYKLKHTYEESYINVNNYTDTLPGPGPHAFKHYNPIDLSGHHKNQYRLDMMECVPAPQINMYPLDLERSTVQDLSGLPLNNSRVLNFNWRRFKPQESILPDIGENPQVTRPHALVIGQNPTYEGINYESESNAHKGDTFDVIIFMQYLKVARVFIDNIQIEE